MYNLDYIDNQYLEILKQQTEIDYLSTDKLTCQRIENGYVLPAKFMEGIPYGGPVGGVFTSEKEFILNSLLMIDGDWYESENEELIFEDETVFYLGTFFSGWGHFITDSLKKMWFLLTPEFQKLKAGNIKLVCTVIPEFKFNANHIALLSMIGVDVKDIHIVTKPTRYKNIYLPDTSFTRLKLGEDDYRGRYYTKEYLDLINHITTQIPDTAGYEKVYYSRTGLHSSRDVGEKDIEKLFKLMGFKIVKPERLTFVEQLSILQGCKCFAATEGSISHNAIFLKEGTQTIIFRKYWGVNEYQLTINAAKKLRVTYVDAHLTMPRIDGFAGPFFMYLNEQVQRFANDFASVSIPFSGFYYSNYSEYYRILVMSTSFNDLLPDAYYHEMLKKELKYTQLRLRIPRFVYRVLTGIFPFLSSSSKLWIVDKMKLLLRIK
jgi:hypothetical protein